MISAVKNSNKFPKKTRFWKEKISCWGGCGNTWANDTGHMGENKPRFESLFNLDHTPSWWNNDGHHIFNSQGSGKEHSPFFVVNPWCWSKVLPSTKFSTQGNHPNCISAWCSTYLCCYCWIWKGGYSTKQNKTISDSTTHQHWIGERGGGKSRAQLRKKSRSHIKEMTKHSINIPNTHNILLFIMCT
jgi:hypothetical protein